MSRPEPRTFCDELVRVPETSGDTTDLLRPLCAQAFARIDTHTGEVQMWRPGPRAFCEELVFVPGPNGDTVEDDGHLLGMVFDAALNRSCLVVRPPRLPWHLAHTCLTATWAAPWCMCPAHHGSCTHICRAQPPRWSHRASAQPPKAAAHVCLSQLLGRAALCVCWASQGGWCLTLAQPTGLEAVPPTEPRPARDKRPACALPRPGRRRPWQPSSSACQRTPASQAQSVTTRGGWMARRLNVSRPACAADHGCVRLQQGARRTAVADTPRPSRPARML